MTIDAGLVELAESLAAETQAQRFCPESPTAAQGTFLALEDDEALYGGAAGGGKSSALLAGVLEGVDIPGYSGIILRKQYADLVMTGGLLDRAHLWLGPTAAEWSAGLMQYRFPSGARVSFGHLNAESLTKLQGAEFHHVAIDEAGQLDPKHILYAGSRLRRHRAFPYKPRMRLASNPGGPAHQFLFDRYVGESSRFPFIPAKLTDNPHIDQAEYTARLMELDSTTRAQLLEGQWILDRSELLYAYAPERNLCDYSELPPADELEHILAVDLGTSQIKPSTSFVVSAFSPHDRRTFTLEAILEAGLTPHTTAEKIKALEERYGPFVDIVVDDGGLGGGYILDFQNRWRIGCRAADKKNKLGHRKLLNGALERGDALILEAPATEPLIEELETVRWNEAGTDNEKSAKNHVTDAYLYGWRASLAYLATEREDAPAPGDERAADEYRARKLIEEEHRTWKTNQNEPWWIRA